MKFTIYSPVGKILRSGECPDGHEAGQCLEGELLLLVPSMPNVDFVADGAVLPLPNKPSPYHVFNYTTKQWEDPRTLQDLKDAQWTLIKQARTQAEYAGFTWDGSTFDSDAISQNRITGAVTLAQLSPSFTIDWTLADNTVRTLGQMDMFQVGEALGFHVQTQFVRGQSLREQIATATTREAVEAIVWPVAPF